MTKMKRDNESKIYSNTPTPKHKNFQLPKIENPIFEVNNFLMTTKKNAQIEARNSV